MCKTPNKFDYKAFMAMFASKIKVPVRESLLQCLAGHDDDGLITKDEFIDSFAQFEDSKITKWSMACLFYQLDLEDGFDECLQLETLVRVVSETKGIPYSKFLLCFNKIRRTKHAKGSSKD